MNDDSTPTPIVRLPAPVGADVSHVSVTTLGYSLASVGPMPSDLNAALNLACYSCHLVHGLLHFLTSAPTPLDPGDGNARRLVVITIERIRAEYPYHGVLKDVTNELTVVSEPNSRFDAANAHQAAMSLVNTVMLHVQLAADPVAFSNGMTDTSVIAEKFDAIRAAFSARQWPDPLAIWTACQIEAQKAAEARRARETQRDTQKEPSGDELLSPEGKELLGIAKKLGLKFKQLDLVEILARSDSLVPLPNIGLALGWLEEGGIAVPSWGADCDSKWNSLVIKVNKRLKSHGWRIRRKGNKASAVKFPATRSAPK